MAGAGHFYAITLDIHIKNSYIKVTNLTKYRKEIIPEYLVIEFRFVCHDPYGEEIVITERITKGELKYTKDLEGLVESLVKRRVRQMYEEMERRERYVR